jgi:hypothetical protein
MRPQMFFEKVLDLPFDARFKSMEANYKRRLREAEKFLVANVSNYIFRVAGKDAWDLNVDIPSFACPFEQMWMEYPGPTYVVNDREGRIECNNPPRNLGALLRVYPNEDRSQIRVSILMAMETEDGAICPCAAKLEIVTDGDGQIIPMDVLVMRVHNSITSPTPTGAVDAMRSRLIPFLLGVSFMNCVNVARETREIAPIRAKGHGANARPAQPGVRYSVLNIGKMTNVLRDEGGAETHGLKRALHRCRGHFARYGPKYNRGRLFGKLEGRFWIPETERGNPEHGEVKHVYNVNPPDAA